MLFSILHSVTASQMKEPPTILMLAMRCWFYKYLFRYVCAVSQTDMLWYLHCIIYQYMYCDACITSQYIHSRFWRSTKHWSLLPRSHIWFPTTSLLIDWTGSRKKEICRHLNERQKIRPPPPPALHTFILGSLLRASTKVLINFCNAVKVKRLIQYQQTTIFSKNSIGLVEENHNKIREETPKSF